MNLPKHVSPMRHQTSAYPIVHRVRDENETLCGFKYMSDKELNGHRIPRASTTDRPLTCGRCIRQIRTLIAEQVKIIPVPNMEGIYDLCEDIIHEQRT